MPDRESAQRVIAHLALSILEHLELREEDIAIRRFADRGFSERVVKHLIEGGLRYPEELLQKSESELRRLPNIWDKAIEEN